MTPTIVLCMAGVYRRFRDAGYTTPKFLLDLGTKPILQHVVEGLGAERVLLVANRRDLTHDAAVRTAVREAGAELLGLAWIGDTGGQAETAAIGARLLREQACEGPVLFHNVDTVVQGRSLAAIGARLARADGFIDVFDADSPAFSYVALDGERVTEIREKVVISRHATTGLYGFRSADAYLQAAARVGQRPAGEFYISDVYRQLLDEGAAVLADPVGEGHTTRVLGTPAEYEAAVEAWGA